MPPAPSVETPLGKLWNSAIRPSVCPMAQLLRLQARWLPAAGRPPEMCGLRTRPRTDVEPPRFLDQTAIGGEGDIVSPPPGRYLVYVTTDTARSSALRVLNDYALYKSTQLLTCSLCVQVLVRRVGVAM